MSNTSVYNRAFDGLQKKKNDLFNFNFNDLNITLNGEGSLK